MSHKNPVHEAIYRSVVKPAMSNRKMSVEGSIMHVDYYSNTARVYWRDPDSSAERESLNVPLPVDGDGVYKQAVEAGDLVTLAFKNGNHNNPYITIVHKKQQGISYESKNGAGIPKETIKQPQSSSWKNVLMDLHYGHEIIDNGSESAKDYIIKEYEVALKHKETGAVVKLTDDGFVDIFAGPQVGVRIDPHTNSINLFGDNVNVSANNFNLRTKPYGFNWNGKAFNPNSENMMTAPITKTRYSEGMVELMKDLGLPAEVVDKEDK
jgi:hypothetical protein